MQGAYCLDVLFVAMQIMLQCVRGGLWAECCKIYGAGWVVICRADCG